MKIRQWNTQDVNDKVLQIVPPLSVRNFAIESPSGLLSSKNFLKWNDMLAFRLWWTVRRVVG